MTAPPGSTLVRRIEQIIAEAQRAGLKVLAIYLTARDTRVWRGEVETLIHASTGADVPTYRGIPVRGAMQGRSVVVAQDRAGRRGACAIADREAPLDATGALPVVWRAMKPPTRN